MINIFLIIFFLGGKIAGAIIGGMAGLALGIAGYIYFKSISKKGKPLSKSSADYRPEEDEMDVI